MPVIVNGVTDNSPDFGTQTTHQLRGSSLLRRLSANAPGHYEDGAGKGREGMV